MKLTFRPSIPIEHKVEKTTRTLNTLSGVTATSVFINEIPRHYLITIEIPDESTFQEVLEIGALIGVMDNDR